MTSKNQERNPQKYFQVVSSLGNWQDTVLPSSPFRGVSEKSRSDFFICLPHSSKSERSNNLYFHWLFKEKIPKFLSFSATDYSAFQYPEFRVLRKHILRYLISHGFKNRMETDIDTEDLLVITRGGQWANGWRWSKGTNVQLKDKFWGCHIQHGERCQHHHIVYLQGAKKKKFLTM